MPKLDAVGFTKFGLDSHFWNSAIGVRYVITLDADTRLPRDAARSLIGVSEAGAQVLGPIAATLAYGEGLQAHAQAAEMRLKR